MQLFLGSEPWEPGTALELNATVVRKRQYQKKYLDYWMSTQHITKHKRPIDAIVMPVAPFPAARPEGYDYYGYSMIINLLDYTSVVVPVTTVDKEVDVLPEHHKPLSELDTNFKNCRYMHVFIGLQQLTSAR